MTTSTELPWAAPTAGAPWAAPSARGPVMRFVPALAALATVGIAVDDITATAKTLPGFAMNWSAMLAGGAC